MPKIRIKTHQFPGDIHKQAKIDLLEKGGAPGAKSWKKDVLLVRERAILKERTKAEIASALDDGPSDNEAGEENDT